MFLHYLIAAVFTLTVCMAANRIGGLLGVVDSPDGVRKIHENDTPLVGGVAAIVPFVSMSVYLGTSSGYAPLYYVLAAVAGGSLILGYVDDRGHVRPIMRLILSATLCLVALYAVPALRVEAFAFSFLRAPIFLHGWAILFTVICLVGLQNAVNMADGKNGLVLGLSFVWTICLLVYAPSHLTPLLMVLAIGLVIAAPFNWKGHLFLGDSGAYALSIAIAVLVVYVYSVKFAVLPADVVALWFLVPIVDCLRLMVARVLAGRSPFNSDRNHLHHILNDLMPWGRALAFYLLLVAVPALLAFHFPEKTLLWALFTFACYCMLVFVGARGLAHRRLGTL